MLAPQQVLREGVARDGIAHEVGLALRRGAEERAGRALVDALADLELALVLADLHPGQLLDHHGHEGVGAGVALVEARAQRDAVQRLAHVEALLREVAGDRADALLHRPEVVDQQQVVELLVEPVRPEVRAADELVQQLRAAERAPALPLGRERRAAEQVEREGAQRARVDGLGRSLLLVIGPGAQEHAEEQAQPGYAHRHRAHHKRGTPPRGGVPGVQDRPALSC